MTTNQTSPALSVTPEPTPEPKGLPCVQLPCPKCGEPLANISLNLWTLDDPEAGNFFCGECEAESSINEVRSFIKRWSAILGWLESIPDVSAE